MSRGPKKGTKVLTVDIGDWARREGHNLEGLERGPHKGRDLGDAFEMHIKEGLRAYNSQRRYRRQTELAACWTQPGFVKSEGQWRPLKKGWVDLSLFLPDRQTVTVDLKAVDMDSPDNKYRWNLDEKLRRDLGGHQIACLDRLTALEHRAGVLLGRFFPARLCPWTLYFVPTAMDFNRPSIPWEEVEGFRVRNGQQWWEVPR